MSGKNAAARLKEAGCEVSKTDRIYVAVSDIYRDPEKKPDAPSVLALTVRQLAALGPLDEREAARAMGTTAAIVDALTRWESLSAEAKKGFDAGRWPLDLLPAVLDFPRAQQAERADDLVRSGIKTAKGATRRKNAAKDAADPWARRMTPRQLEAFAARLDGVNMAHEDDEARLEGVALGLRLAMGSDARTILRGEPLAEILHRERKAMHTGAKKKRDHRPRSAAQSTAPR